MTIQTGPQRPHGVRLPIPPTLTGGVEDTALEGVISMLDEVDYSDAGAVATARAALAQRDVWGDMVDWAFQEGREDEGLAAVARIIMCQKAEVWRRGTESRIAVPGLNYLDEVAAQVDLFSVLSPRGVQALSASHEVAADGIRYRPCTGVTNADRLLGMVVPSMVIRELRSTPGDSRAAAELLDQHAEAWRQVAPLRAEARCLEDESWAACVDRDLGRAARAMERAAEKWEGADQSGQAAALALGNAAIQWRAHGNESRAAELDTRAAKIWHAAGLPGDAARAYNRAAISWFLDGQHTRADEARISEALALEAASRY